MNNLESALNFGGILSPKDAKYVTGFFETLDLKQGEYFLPLGKVSNQIGFVDSGVLRAYAIGGDVEEVSKYFVRKNQFVVDIESFYDNKPSTSAIQAVTECRILMIKRKVWNRLNEEVPKLYILTKSLTEAALLNKIKDNEFLHFGSAKDKYLEFIKDIPTWR
jgi:CRP-like cAMP-binding protein